MLALAGLVRVLRLSPALLPFHRIVNPIANKMSSLTNISIHDGSPKAYPKIFKGEPVVAVDGFHHLAVTCSDIRTSQNFYEKIGFRPMADKSTNQITVLKNKGGLELHLARCDQGLLDEGKNILMDYPTRKFPGHTHASFVVPNVAAAQRYMESQGISISGDRTRGGRLYAVFARDPDRTTYEFEKNHGEPEPMETITADRIGYPQCMDHVGIRVCNAEDGLLWYAEMLGFTLLVNKYDRNPDPLKNNPPWISRIASEDPNKPNCDINFIINGNEPVSENILLAEGSVRPGILILGLTIVEPSTDCVQQKLLDKGVHVVTEAQLPDSKWACLVGKVLPSPSKNTLFLEDREHTLIRLWPKE